MRNEAFEWVTPLMLFSQIFLWANLAQPLCYWWQDRKWNAFVDRWAQVALRDPAALDIVTKCPNVEWLAR